MSTRLKRWADALTVARLALIPPLWALALLRLPVYLGIGVAVASSTDMVDGYLARRSGRTSRFGSQLDSLADVLLMCSTVAWLLMLRGSFFREHAAELAVWLGVGAAALAVGWFKFRRFGNLHLYSTKAAGVMAYVFSCALLILGDVNELLWYVTIGACIVASTETLLVQLLRTEVDEHIGSIVRVLGRR
jgi:CDP-diacylglycerol--glycerol-3-phosphate 3-phosphatidyltransferase